METLSCTLRSDGGTLRAAIAGSVDHHTVRPVREEIDRAVRQYMPRELILDLADVEFMDSSGLGLILGRYTLAQDLGAKVTLRGVSAEIMKIIKLSGIEKLIPIEGQKKGGAAS